MRCAIDTIRVLQYDSICGKEPATETACMEQGNSGSHQQSCLYPQLNQDRQDAWNDRSRQKSDQ